MKRLIIIISAIIFLALLFAVKSNIRESSYQNFIGSWIPLEPDADNIFSKIQIEERDGFFILGGITLDEPTLHKRYFYVCEKQDGYLSIEPDQYFNEEYVSSVTLVKPAKLYFDKEANIIYFLNTVYIRDNGVLFFIRDRKIIFNEE